MGGDLGDDAGIMEPLGSKSTGESAGELCRPPVALRSRCLWRPLL